MKRRELLRYAKNTALLTTTASLSTESWGQSALQPLKRPIVLGKPLKAPTQRKIRALFAIADDAQVIDFAGPWEVFNNVHVHDRGPSMDEMMPFELSTVAATLKPVTATGGMRLIPNYTFDKAPRADVVVVPALKGNPELLEWLQSSTQESDVVMSVCTGAFQLGAAGLLEGMQATTHHGFYRQFTEQFPGVKLVQDVRFVESPNVSTAGGLTSGIDLAIRVVERYFGRFVAQQTADYMEYTGEGWRV